MQVKGLSELVNHSTIVIAGFRVYTRSLNTVCLSRDVCGGAFAGVRNHSGTVHPLGIAEGNGLRVIEGFSPLSRSPRETGGSFVVCSRATRFALLLVARFYSVCVTLAIFNIRT